MVPAAVELAQVLPAQEGRASARPQRCVAALDHPTHEVERRCATLRPRGSAALLARLARRDL